jgi:hypothetical protein
VNYATDQEFRSQGYVKRSLQEHRKASQMSNTIKKRKYGHRTSINLIICLEDRKRKKKSCLQCIKKDQLEEG